MKFKNEFRIFKDDSDHSIRWTESPDRMYSKIISAPSYEELRSEILKMVSAFGKAVLEEKVC